ncbi:hypothetical protein LDL59_09330 [Kaistella anthropi]|nr:hypothetical protein [Kaistella anthropi]
MKKLITLLSLAAFTLGFSQNFSRINIRKVFMKRMKISEQNTNIHSKSF